MMATFQDLTYYYLGTDLVWHRWMRGEQPPGSSAPGAPTSVRASLSGTTVTVTWAPPASDGGSPVTGYYLTKSGGSPLLVGNVLTTTYTVASGTTAVTGSIAAANDVGVGPGAVFSASSATAARFPGDTQSKLTGTWMLGIDEADKDPTKVTSPEVAAPENLAGTPPAGIRYYYRNWAAMNYPGGAIFTDSANQINKGRFAWPSVTVGATGESWLQASDGRHDTLFDAYIAGCEETTPVAPRPVSFSHEPNFNSTVGYRAQDFGHFMRYFRSRMDVYAGKHGGVGVYKWKQLSFGPIHTAQDYAKASSPGYVQTSWDGAAKVTATASAATDTITSAGHLLADGRRVKFLAPPAGLNTSTSYYVVQATADTFKVSLTLGGAPVDITADASGVTVVSRDVYDWMGVDPYVSRNGVISSYWTGNFAAALAWVEDPAHTYPLGIAEYAIYNRDPDAATKLQQFYDRCLDGTHDVWCCLYYNAGDQGQPGTSLFTQFILDNVNNGGLLNKYVALLKDKRTVHYWDLTRPDGTRYQRPAGV